MMKRPSKWYVYNLGRKAGREEQETFHDYCMESILKAYSKAQRNPKAHSKEIWSAIKEAVIRNDKELW